MFTRGTIHLPYVAYLLAFLWGKEIHNKPTYVACLTSIVYVVQPI